MTHVFFVTRVTWSTSGWEEIGLSDSSSGAPSARNLATISASINLTELVASPAEINSDGAWLQETFPAWLKEVVTHMHMDLVGV